MWTRATWYNVPWTKYVCGYNKRLTGGCKAWSWVDGSYRYRRYFLQDK